MGEVEAQRVGAVGARQVLRVQEGEAVADDGRSVGIACPLQTVEVVDGLLSEGREILVLPVLVVDTLGPVAHELAVEDLEDMLLAHDTTDLLRHLVELARQCLAHELPKQGVVSRISVGADALVEALLVDGVVIDQLTIIAHAKDRIIVIG